MIENFMIRNIAVTTAIIFSSAYVTVHKDSFTGFMFMAVGLIAYCVMRCFDWMIETDLIPRRHRYSTW